MAKMTREAYKQRIKERIESEASVPKIKALNDDLVCYNCRYRFSEDGKRITGAGGCYLYEKTRYKYSKPNEVLMSDQTGKDDKSVCKYYRGFKLIPEFKTSAKASARQRKAIAALDKAWDEEANKLGKESYLEGGPKRFEELDQKYKQKIIEAIKQNR